MKANGVMSKNYTSNEMYLEQTPIIVTIKTKVNANLERLNEYIEPNKDDVVINTGDRIIFTVRRTSKSKYGLLTDKKGFKVS